MQQDDDSTASETMYAFVAEISIRNQKCGRKLK